MTSNGPVSQFYNFSIILSLKLTRMTENSVLKQYLLYLTIFLTFWSWKLTGMTANGPVSQLSWDLTVY